MYHTSFNIRSVSQDISINPSQISATSDRLNSFLTIPISHVFRAKQFNVFEVISITAKLKLQEPQILLSHTIESFTKHVIQSECVGDLRITFILNPDAIDIIEKFRVNDANFILDLSFLLWNGRIQGTTVNGPIQWDYTEVKNGILQINIAKSIWAEKLLGDLGYECFKLIQIPLSHKTVKEAYKNIIKEFTQAEKYFNLHEYDECVGKCRNTLDALNRELKNFKKEVKSNSNFEWLNTVTAETYQWIDAMDKQTYRLASKPHHSTDSLTEYSRSEAHSIYLVVLGLLNYIGNL